MARSIAVDQELGYRAVHQIKRADGVVATKHEGVYGTRAVARGRLTFWEGFYANLAQRCLRNGSKPVEYVDGWIEETSFAWRRVD